MKRDADCVLFLQWALPRLRSRWAGFRKVGRQVCRRIQRRLRELGLDSYNAYGAHLGANADERQTLDGLCRVTIERFYRDKGVFDTIGSAVLPDLAAGALCEGRSAISKLWSVPVAAPQQVLWVMPARERRVRRTVLLRPPLLWPAWAGWSRSGARTPAGLNPASCARLPLADGRNCMCGNDIR